MTEPPLQARIRLVLGSRSDIRIFRNSCGVGWLGKVVNQSANSVVLHNPYRVTFGLCPGSADLVGFRTIIITPDMVGKRVAVFLSCEVKTPTGKVADHQTTWTDQLNAKGACAFVARTDDREQLEKLMKENLP